MGIRIGFNPSATHAGMGEKFAGPGGQGAGMPSGVWGTSVPTASPEDIGWQGYNPAVVAANAPVTTGNEFAPTGGVNPFNSNPYNIDNIAQPTDWYGNPTSGWESFAPTGGFNPFNTNPFNIDNIVQPAPAYPTMNAPYNIAAPWVNPNIGFGYQDPFGWYREQNRSR